MTARVGCPLLAGCLLNFAHLKDVAKVLGDTLPVGGKHLPFCSELDLSRKYPVPPKGAIFCDPPIDEAPVCDDQLEPMYLKKGEPKTLDTA